MARLMKMSETEKKLYTSLKMCMRDFRTAKEELKDYSSIYGLETITLDQDVKPLPYMIFLTLTGLLGFRYHGREEKVAWSIPFVYKGKPFMISHQKFGVMIATIPGDKEAIELAPKMLRQLSRGIRIADRLLKPVVGELVKNGEITVVNKSFMLHGFYSFFRKRAELAFRRSEIKPVKGDFHEAIRNINRAMKFEWKGFYYTRAMLDAFYSWLEHVLVLLVPFCNYDKSTDDIGKLMSADWTSKFNRVLTPETDREAKQVYNQLREVKERYRNILAHGFFDKSGASALVHMPVVGAIPISLSSYRHSIHFFSLLPVTKDVFLKICNAFDNAESLLRRNRFPLPFAIIDSGLDIFFHDEGLIRYANTIQSPDKTKQFIEGMSRLADDVINMDW